MTVKQLKEYLERVPEKYEVFVFHCKTVDNVSFCNLNGKAVQINLEDD